MRSTAPQGGSGMVARWWKRARVGRMAATMPRHPKKSHDIPWSGPTTLGRIAYLVDASGRERGRVVERFPERWRPGRGFVPLKRPVYELLLPGQGPRGTAGIAPYASKATLFAAIEREGLSWIAFKDLPRVKG